MDGKMTYKITKLINNNVVFSKDENEKEIIIFGKAIGFSKKPGETIETSRIISIFTLQNKQERDYLTNLAENIDPLYIDIAIEIVQEFEKRLRIKVNDMMRLSLSDHISNAVSNAKENFFLKLDILYQLKGTYPQEYAIALDSLDLIEEKTGVKLPEDEAGFILLHYICSQGTIYESNGKEKANFQAAVVESIEKAYGFKINKNTFYYTRFLTHLSFFTARIKDYTLSVLGSDFVYQAAKTKYPEVVIAVENVEKIVEKTYGVKMSDEEKGYLALHILNLIKSTKDKEQ